MKICYYLILLMLMINNVWAQMSMRPSPKDMKPQKNLSFDKFYERLKVGYFGVFSSPNFREMKKGNWNNAAASPDGTGGTNNDTWPTNMWHQISFNYNFGSKMNFVFNPRFMTPLGSPVDMKKPEDRSFMMLDDFLFGFQGVVVNSEDKAFNLWLRPAMRIPTSHASRNGGNGGSGTLSNQIELAYNATYDFNKTWQLGLFGQIRTWIIEDQIGTDRFRFYTAPFIQYTINDTSRVLTYFETITETDRRGKPINDRKPVFKDLLQDLFVGYSKDITSKFNIMPYAGVYVNDTPVTDKSFFIAAWISYQIK
jgi:hypothetical protein